MTIVYDGFYKVDRVVTPQGIREVVRATNSVSVLFHDKVNKTVLLISQPHATLISDGNPDGSITECVAGRFDCDLGPKALIVKEALEEVGVTITEKDVLLLNNGVPMAVCAGMTDEVSYLAYVKITPDMVEQTERIFGCDDEGEEITRVWMSVTDFLKHECECTRLFAFQQWLENQICRSRSQTPYDRMGELAAENTTEEGE